MNMNKKLYVLSFKQLIECNLHLGQQTSYWADLSMDIIIGQRLNNFLLNVNLGVLNLKKSLHLVELMFLKKHKTLFFIENKIYLKKLLNSIQFFTQFNFNFVLIKWCSGCLTNYKNFRIFIYPLIKKIIFLCTKTQFFLEEILLLTKWSKFLGLLNLESLPVHLVSFSKNISMISEAQILGIPITQQVDNSYSGVLLNKITYLLPFNLANSRNFLMIFNLYFNSFLMGILRFKKLFLKMLIFLLSFNKKKRINILPRALKKYFDINYSFIINFYKLCKRNHLNVNKRLKKRTLLLNKILFFKRLSKNV